VRVILASRSPRRRELLKKLVPDFETVSAEADEDYIGASPSETVIEISKRKANAVICPAESIVIASDTLVYFNGVYLGKPRDRADAKRMLTMLSGNTHTVFSGVAVRAGEHLYTASAKSDVTFWDMAEADIDDYIATHEVMDKAGAYAIQDGVLVSSYTGEYANIMGLPLEILKDILGKIGLK